MDDPRIAYTTSPSSLHRSSNRRRPNQMISPSGELSYTNAPSPWRTAEQSAPLLTTFLLAALATLISYQLTSFVTDILLGAKPRRESPIPSLQTLLLVRQASPIAVLANLLRLDPLTRAYYSPVLGKGTTIARDPTHIRPQVAARLLLLLLAAPAINVLSIILPLESSQTLSFSAAGTGGFSLSTSPRPFRSASIRVNGHCERQSIALFPGDTAIAELDLCAPPSSFERVWLSQGSVSVIVIRESVIMLAVQVGRVRRNLFKQATLKTGEDTYVLRVNVGEDTVAGIMEEGMKLMASICMRNISDANRIKVGLFDRYFEHIETRGMECDVDTEVGQWASRYILTRLSRFVTVVDAKVMELGQFEQFAVGGVAAEAEWLNGKDLPFLARRRRNLGLRLMAIAAIFAVSLRILSAIIWNNDIDEGIDLIIKQTVKLGCCDSLVRDGNEKIVYNHMHQIGNVARFGLIEQGMPEVTRFEGAEVGADVSCFDLAARDLDGIEHSCSDSL